MGKNGKECAGGGGGGEEERCKEMSDASRDGALRKFCSLLGDVGRFSSPGRPPLSSLPPQLLQICFRRRAIFDGGSQAVVRARGTVKV